VAVAAVSVLVTVGIVVAQGLVALAGVAVVLRLGGWRLRVERRDGEPW
jgi:hypothetical protein